VSSDVLVTLLESTVLLDIVQVISANDDRLRHLCADAHSLEHASSDAHVSGERTFLVNVVSILGRSGGLETKTDVTVESRLLSFSLGKNSLLGTDEDGRLFHVRSLILIEDFVGVNVSGSHIKICLCVCVCVCDLRE